MKLSFCSIAFRKVQDPLSAIIPRLAGIGYAGVEIWAKHLNGDGLDAEAVKSVLAANGLAVPMISPYFNVTGGPKEWETTLEQARRTFADAVNLNSPLVRVFTGFRGSAEVDNETWRAACARLAALCDLAADNGLALALETHPKTLVDNVEAIHRLLAAVKKSNLVLNLDIYHMWERHQDPLWIWEQLRPHVRHVHAKNAVIPPSNGDEYPLFHDQQGLQEIVGVTYLDRGNMDYKPFLEAIARDGFKGWLSVEWFGPAPYEAALHELSWLKNLTMTSA